MNSVKNSFIKSHHNTNFLLTNSNFLESQQPTTNASNESSQVSINEKKIGEVWSKHNFDTNKIKVENLLTLNNVKTTWGSGKDNMDKIEEQNNVAENEDINRESKSITDPDEDPQSHDQIQEETSPSHHARRPPNAFLIFCKKHRPIVRQRYPTTENRGVTKILGEWWALINSAEKQPYNDLAKEYKDAFLTANPDFRWYKLPAPPLRTLTTRPTTIITLKPSPSTTVSTPLPTYLPEFTPGKLADESQLGGLTSLMNNNYGTSKKSEEDEPCCKVEDNNNENPTTNIYNKDTKLDEKIQKMFSSPTTFITKPTLPPKPIKKRIFDQFEDEKNSHDDKNDNLTQQDLLNKVVDGIFASDEPKDQRKSDRMCKGKRYERFMFEGKLLGNKRDTKLTQHHRVTRTDSKMEQEMTVTKPIGQESTKFNLENTIKRLAERTNAKIDLNEDLKPKVERVRTISETSEGPKSSQVNFNLDLRIDNLPSLSYDDFIRRKRESKKRKLKIKTDTAHHNSKIQRLENNNLVSKPEITSPPVVGSKKRKNKLSITHLNTTDNCEDGAVLPNDNALLGLATLAMVAASTEKIEENVDM